MEITLDGCQFKYYTCYQEEPGLRSSFNALSKKIFGQDYENWYRAGFWTDRYRPYSLLAGDKMVANVSVSPMDLQCMGQNYQYIQLSNVMSDPEYRGRGLIRFLIMRILTDWQGKCSGTYLFANRETQEFFPQFGFEKVREFRHSMLILPDNKRRPIRRLIPELSQDKTLIKTRYAYSNPHALLSWEHNPGLLFRHCNGALREHIYYLPEQDTLAVAEHDGNTMYCHDIFCPAGHELEDLLSGLARPETEKVVLGFTPWAGARCSVRPLMDRNATLFMLKGQKSVLQDYQCRFPALSHA